MCAHRKECRVCAYCLVDSFYWLCVALTVLFIDPVAPDKPTTPPCTNRVTSQGIDKLLVSGKLCYDVQFCDVPLTLAPLWGNVFLD